MRLKSNNQKSAMPKGRAPYKPVPGSTLPQKMRDELEEKETDDDRTFTKRFVNRAANRKEQRKQDRKNKGKRKSQQQQQQLHVKTPTEQGRSGQPEAKRQKKNESVVVKGTPENKTKKKAIETSNASALERLSKSNPQFYSLLVADSLINTGKDAFEQDDKEIAYWEKKLGMKKNQKPGKAFEDDGLLDILGDLGKDEREGQMDDQHYLQQKRAKQKAAQLNEKAEAAVDDIFDGLDDDEEGLDSNAEEDTDMEDITEDGMDDDGDDDESMGDLDSGEDSEDNVIDQDNDGQLSDDLEKTPKAESNSQSAAPTKYMPPHLRKAANTKSEQQLKLQRLLQGLFNKLSEGNMESILWEIESCYSKYPRHDVTSTITDIVLTSISQKSNLLDSFVIIYATVIASFYRLVGVEFAAHFVQALVEMFESNFKACCDAIAKDQNDNEEGPKGAKESKNLLTLTLELYNFQVISCVLVYDLVRMLISRLDEHGVELLLKILRTCGPQLRVDDPAALKDIIDEIQKETDNKGRASISTRHRFMLETIANIKNNKIKHGPTASGQGEKEMIQKMKKFLNGLSKKRTVRSAEPLRVTLQDIHDIDTKGKWWLVGASWKDNMVGTESKHDASSKIPDDLKKDQSQHQVLLRLAKKQGMNTDIRRSIFVTIMSAEDYLDAFEKLMKLTLNEVQQREIARVLLQCTGNETSFNPYYMLVGRRLCELHHSFRVTFQYCLWDFMRELGESGIGGMDHSSEATVYNEDHDVPLSRIINMAKFYASLIANGSLTFAILKTVSFISLGDNARIFLENLFAHAILQAKEAGTQAVTEIFSKVKPMELLAQGCILFISESVIRCAHVAISDDKREALRSGCQAAIAELRKKKTLGFL